MNYNYKEQLNGKESKYFNDVRIGASVKHLLLVKHLRGATSHPQIVRSRDRCPKHGRGYTEQNGTWSKMEFARFE